MGANLWWAERDSNTAQLEHWNINTGQIESDLVMFSKHIFFLRYENQINTAWECRDLEEKLMLV
jgi:hypothetical protein